MLTYVVGNRGKLGRLICKELSLTNDPTSADCIIDVSSPSALDTVLSYQKPLVIGTTGHTLDQLKKIQNPTFPIFWAPNFSIGIALLMQFLKNNNHYFKAAKIEETHHLEKKDCPSGTALLLSKQLTSPPAITSHRIPEVVGTHTLLLELENESLHITHTAASRTLFAKGAIAAANFIIKQKPGLYTMNDLIESQSI